MKTKRNWYAIYTKPRWEKKVDGIFKEREIVSYCPLNKVRKKWSDRYKIVEEPLFKSYGFVYIEASEMQKVRMVNGVVNFVYWNGKPAIVKDQEIDDIKKFLNEYKAVDVVQLDLKLNTKVMINQGIMMGREATVERILHNVVELRIETLGYKLLAKTERTNVVPIE